jgi:cytochrome c oxidase subunit II
VARAPARPLGLPIFLRHDAGGTPWARLGPGGGGQGSFELHDTRLQFRNLQALYLPVALAVAALVFGAVLFALVRYRARPGREPSRKAEAKVLESLYVLALAGIVALLVVRSSRTEDKVDPPAAHPALTVDVTAAKWNWSFAYPSLGVTIRGVEDRASVLRVPTGKVVRFHLTSLDVIHGFWIPAIRFKRDVFPRRTTSIDLVFDHDMVNRGECSVYCGLKHSTMLFIVRALPPASFSRWATQAKARRAA